MAKKKNGNKKAAETLKTEDYIRTKVRLLPIYKCYKAVNLFEDREMCIIVFRKHPQGTFSCGAYMIDKWCLGVKDSFWRFSINEDELQETLSFIEETLNNLDEISYVEAHNWVYGAVAFAEDAGIKPCKEFALSQYFLEEDDEKTELIEYEFGRDGKYCLLTKSYFEASKYIPTLDKNLGKGNYSVETGGYDSWDEGEDEEDRDWQNFQPYTATPNMEYTYKGGDYPKEIELNYPEIEEILKRDTEDISDDDIGTILSLIPEKLREDLQNLILRQLGIQWGKSMDELGEDGINDWRLVGNSMIFLTAVATVEDTLPVVLEVMRQSKAFYEFNFCDSAEDLIWPVLYALIKDNPRLLKPYLLEAGLHYSFKHITLELLESIACHEPESTQEIIDMTVELLNEYKKDLPKRTICDGTVTAFAIGIFITNNAKKQLPLIEELYATGLVNEFINGHIDSVRKAICKPHESIPLPDSDLYTIIDSLR